MTTTRKIISATLAAAMLSAASMAVSTPAFAKGGKHSGNHRHHHHNHHHRFNKVWFYEYGTESCWIFTKRYGWVNACAYN
jgi:hypothetical protein